MHSIKAIDRVALILSVAALVGALGVRTVRMEMHTTRPVELVQGSYVKAFTSWGQLKGASTYIVVATAGAQQTTLDAHKVPWTVTEAHVERALQGGAAVPQTFLVRQLGGIGGDGRNIQMEGFPLLDSGSRYLMFLTPTQIIANQYYPVGAPMGVFSIDASGNVDSYSAEAAQIGIPIHGVPLDQVVHALQVASVVPTTP